MRIIRKEIVIYAPPAKVWEHITVPQKIAGWLLPNDFEAKIGRAFSMQCPDQGQILCVVKEIVPPQKLVYSFHSSVTRVETLVTITLAAAEGGTRVILVHSGWDALPPPDQQIADNFDEGWGKLLEKLRTEIAATT